MTLDPDAAPHRPILEVFIGEHDVSNSTSDLHLGKRVNAPPTASFALHLSSAPGETLDYFAPVRVDLLLGTQRERHLDGFVQVATPANGIAKVECTAVPELADRLLRQSDFRNISPAEIFWTIARSLGLPEDAIEVPGIEEQQLEEVHVVVPIQGATTTKEIDFGGCSLVPRNDIDWILDSFQGSNLLQHLDAASAFVMVKVEEHLLWSAEQHGLRMARYVASWLTTRLRLGSAVLPSGEPQYFDRNVSNAVPSVGSVVAVIARSSERRWIRSPGSYRSSSVAPLQEGAKTYGRPTGRTLAAREMEAFHAFARAAGNDGTISSAVALWQAVEFYVGKTQAPALFNEEEKGKLRKAAPDWLTEEQLERWIKQVNSVNNAHVMTRLRVALARDGIPHTEEDISTLSSLQKTRNLIVHGSIPKAPADEDVRRGLSIVARILLWRNLI